MRILTANIQNFPKNAPDEKYASKENADLRFIREELHPDLVLWQELAEGRDFTRLVDMFGPDYRHTAHHSEDVVTWRTTALQEVTEETFKINDGAGRGSFSPPRFCTHAEFRVPGLPPIDVFDVHMTNEAYIGRNLLPRRPLWDTGFLAVRKAALAALAHGHVVIVGGDWNRRGHDLPRFHKGQKFLVGGGKGIDNIIILCPPGWVARVSHRINRNINSDHNVRGADFKVTRTLKARLSRAKRPA